MNEKQKKQKKQKRQKRMLALSAILALMALVSGTFAWITAQDQRVNKMASAAVADGSTVITETFKPSPIQPSGVTTKEVSVTNGGNQKVYVRASFEEVMKYLASKGEVKENATKFDPSIMTDDAKKQGIGIDWPVEMNPALKTGEKDITALVTGLPAGVKVIGKGVYTKDPATGVETKEFESRLYYTYQVDGADKYQAMKGNVVDITAQTANTDIDTWTYALTAGADKYLVYENGFKFDTANWAKTVIEPAELAAGATGNGASLLGYTGNRYGVKYDYRSQTDSGIIPDAQMKTTAGNFAAAPFPTTSGEAKNTQTDSELGNKIQLVYGDDMVDPSTISAITTGKQWVYNPEDGWFYWLEHVDPTQSTTDLLKKITYDSSIKDEYTNATYDLDVKMEAMQYENSALTAADGFGLSTTPGSVSEAIYNALKQ